VKTETAPQEFIINAFDASNREIKVELFAHGSSTAFEDLNNRLCDLGMASRAIKNEEIKMLKRFGSIKSSKSEYIIGLDGIAIIVNRSNTLEKINKTTLQKIFSGEIADWSQLGLKAGAIDVYARDEKSGTYDTFKSLVLSEQATLTPQALRFESNAKLSEKVSQDPNGIGFVGLPYINQSKALAISDNTEAALKPTPFSVSTEDYLLARRLYFYVPQNAENEYAESLAKFAISEQGQTLAQESGFVSQQIKLAKQAVIQPAPDEYRKLTEAATRLSLNIRFDKGQPIPDNKAVQDIQRVLTFMKNSEYKNRGLMLFGFSEETAASPLYSLGLSTHRADLVANLLVKKGLNVVNVRGFGSEAPVADSATPTGRIKNRRVEIWLR
jgi:phosphate transport system substrate-binding protein